MRGDDHIEDALSFRMRPVQEKCVRFFEADWEIRDDDTAKCRISIAINRISDSSEWSRILYRRATCISVLYDNRNMSVVVLAEILFEASGNTRNCLHCPVDINDIDEPWHLPFDPRKAMTREQIL
jgi:hypothetical protein